MGRLLLLFILVPAIELALLIELGGLIGTLSTIGVIAVTGMVGAALARRQGLGVLQQIQAQTARGELPAGALIDGVLILMAGALLMTPGVLTDAVGFSALLPVGRRFYKALAKRWFVRAVREGRMRVNVDVTSGGFGFHAGTSGGAGSGGPVYDVDVEPTPQGRQDPKVLENRGIGGDFDR